MQQPLLVLHTPEFQIWYFQQLMANTPEAADRHFSYLLVLTSVFEPVFLEPVLL
jgi:hypothetical protein